jgi:hypothetical protein
LKRIEGKLINGKTKKECSHRTIVLPAITSDALRRHQALQNQERTWADAMERDRVCVYHHDWNAYRTPKPALTPKPAFRDW